MDFTIIKVDAKQVDRHLQALLQYFIESASFINLDDGYWQYFLVYARDTLVGYATTFEDFQKAQTQLVLISQVLILPNF